MAKLCAVDNLSVCKHRTAFAPYLYGQRSGLHGLHAIHTRQIAGCRLPVVMAAGPGFNAAAYNEERLALDAMVRQWKPQLSL